MVKYIVGIFRPNGELIHYKECKNIDELIETMAESFENGFFVFIKEIKRDKDG